MYVIWSYEHNAWWRPNRQGYTVQLDKAGRYTAGQAGEIVTSSVMLEEIAIIEPMAIEKGAPTCHPYHGNSESGRFAAFDDLLAACKKLVDPDVANQGLDQIEQAIREGREAIAKAEGGAA